MPSPSFKTLIIVPCYNEQDSVLPLYKAISDIGIYDVLFVNDAGTDNTLRLLRDNAIPHVNLPINLGIGGAVQTGYLYALKNGYDIAVQVDGDGQHDPEQIKLLLEPLYTGASDLVIGSRFLAESKAGFRSTRFRRLGILFFKMLIKILSGVIITDPTSGFRAANQKAMELFVSYYAKDYPEPESTMSALHNGLRVSEVAVKMRPRSSGVSSITLGKSIYYMLKVTIDILFAAFSVKYKFIER